MSGHNDNVSLFYTPVKDTSVKSIEWVEYRPVGQLNSEGALEFNVSGNSTKYMDLQNTRLKIKFRILQGNGQTLPPSTVEGKPTPEAAKVGPVNLFLQTMWRQVDVSLQQQVVSPNVATNYPYKAYIETLLNYGYDAKISKLQSQLYYKDEIDPSNPDPINGSNDGLLLRSAFTDQSKIVDLEGPVYMDICQQNRYILNGVQVNLKFWPSTNQFKLMSPRTSSDYKIEIKEAILKMCMIEVAPEVVVAHAETLQHGPAKYFYPRSDVKSFAIARGQYSTCLEDIYHGEVPNQVVIGFVSSEAFMGNYTKNPLYFQTYNCNFIGFYVDGKSMPAEPLTPNYGAQNYLSAYMTLFGDNSNFGNYISRDEYLKGYCLYMFDICQNNCDKFVQNVRRGHTRLEVKFSEALPEAVTMIIFAKFPGMLEIDQTRNVKIM